MATYTVETQHGKITITVAVTVAPALVRLGLSEKDMEEAAMAILHEKFLTMGGASQRPVKWDN